MRNRSRTLRGLAALAALALLAAACNGNGNGNGSDDDGGAAGADGEETTGEATAADGEGVELQLMGFSSSPAEDQQLSDIIDAYNEQSPNTARFSPQPEYDTTLQAALAGGSPPDVFYVDSLRLPDLVEAGVLDSAEGRLDDEGDFYPSLRDAFTFDGTFWCPPKDFSTLALQYNVAMLEEAGVEPPTTWEELAAAAEALTTDDRVGLVIGPEYARWAVFLFANGGGITNEDFSEMTADSPENHEAFEFLEELHANGFAATQAELDAGWPGEAFGQEKAAMAIEGNWMVGFMRNDFPDVEWEVAELPAGPAGKGTFAFTVCYGVAANAADPDASWDLVNFLVSPEQQLAFTSNFPVMPSRESIADDWLEAHPDLEAFIAGADYARPWQFVPGFQGVVDTANDGIQGLASGNRSTAEVLAEIHAAGEQVLGD